MIVRQFTRNFVSALAGALVLAGGMPSPALAQSTHSHGTASRNQPGELVKVVREATERYRDVAVALHDGYELMFGCVSGPDGGAMGMHFVKGSLLDGVVDPRQPEIVIYEPQPNGRLRLIGADYLVPVSAWNSATAPELMGQFFHFFDAPNRFGLPAFFTLHVWAWKESPTGTFVNWNQNVSCDAYSGQNP
jgi:hypothetical protein